MGVSPTVIKDDEKRNHNWGVGNDGERGDLADEVAVGGEDCNGSRMNEVVMAMVIWKQRQRVPGSDSKDGVVDRREEAGEVEQELKLYCPNQQHGWPLLVKDNQSEGQCLLHMAKNTEDGGEGEQMGLEMLFFI